MTCDCWLQGRHEWTAAAHVGCGRPALPFNRRSRVHPGGATPPEARVLTKKGGNLVSPTLAPASRRSASADAASLYWGLANGESGARGFLRGFVATHALNAGLNSSRKRLR